MRGEFSACELVIDERERAARLSVKAGAHVEGEREALLVLNEVAKPAYILTRVGCSVSKSTVNIGGAITESEALARVLSGLSECYILVATLGYGVDRLLLTLGAEGVYRHFLTDALADCLIEALLDAIVRRECEGTLTNRFSPGYADLDVSFSRELVSMTHAGELLGIKFLGSNLMTPKKTVTAIIGIRE